MNVFELLTLRSEYEDITLNYRIPGAKKPGTLSNLKWFIKNGADRNKKYDDFERALGIATLIVNNEAERRLKQKNDRRRKTTNGPGKQRTRAREH